MKKKYKALIHIFTTLLSFSVLPALISAGPIIKVDSTTVNIGTIRKEDNKIIKHEYIIKNTGDETLKITRVKPG